MASAIAIDRRRPPADRRRGRHLYPRRQDRRADAAYAARSRQSAYPLQRFARPPCRRVLDRHDGQGRRPEGRRRSTGSSRASCARSIPEISIPNSICFSPDGATAYFTGHAARTSSSASTAIRRPACRAASRRASPTRAAARAGSTARWSTPTACCGTPAGAARASTPMVAGRQAAPLDRHAGQAILLPGLRRPERLAARRDVGLEGHGRRGTRRRPRGRQDVPARHRGARPLRAACRDLA